MKRIQSQNCSNDFTSITKKRRLLRHLLIIDVGEIIEFLNSDVKDKSFTSGYNCYCVILLKVSINTSFSLKPLIIPFLNTPVVF